MLLFAWKKDPPCKFPPIIQAKKKEITIFFKDGLITEILRETWKGGLFFHAKKQHSYEVTLMQKIFFKKEKFLYQYWAKQSGISCMEKGLKISGQRGIIGKKGYLAPPQRGSYLDLKSQF